MLLHLLHPFFGAQKMLEGEQYLTASFVPQTLLKTMEIIHEHIHCGDEDIAEIATLMKRKLSAHYLDSNDNIVVDIRIWAAMYFDVRFSRNCMSEAQLQLVRNFILAQSDKLSPLASTAVSTSCSAMRIRRLHFRKRRLQ